MTTLLDFLSALFRAYGAAALYLLAAILGLALIFMLLTWWAELPEPGRWSDADDEYDFDRYDFREADKSARAPLEADEKGGES